jgi:preprotein translocase subunit SecG
MINILLIVHIVIGVLLVISILLQKTSSDSLANLTGNNNSLVSSRGAANFLTKTTIVLAASFMINAIILGNLSTRKSAKIMETEETTNREQKQELPIAK